MTGPIRAVADHLRAAGVPFAVIGAAAMSARGFPRQTLDFDLLTTDGTSPDDVRRIASGLPSLDENARRLWAEIRRAE